MATENVREGSVDTVEGYDYQFLEPRPSDDQKCPICHLVVRNAYQVNCCGKILCEGCLMKYRRQSRRCRCPMCRTHIGNNYFKDTRSDREIKSLKIYCDNEEAGCDWTGEVRKIEKHLEEDCGYQEIECEDCGEEMLELLMETHLSDECPMRDYKCTLCNKQGTYQSITVGHPKVCRNVVLECANRGCFRKLRRRNIPSHLEVCPKQVIDCPFKAMGCSFTSKRENLVGHVEKEVTSHVQLVAQRVPPDSSVLKLTNITLNEKPDTNRFSDSFYSGRGGYKLRLNVEPNESGHVGVYLNLMPGPNDDTLQFPMRGDFTITLLNQIEDRNHDEGVFTACEDSDDVFSSKYKVDSTGWGTPKFIPHPSLSFNRDNNTQYLKDCTLYFRVKCEPSSQTKPWLATVNTACD